MIVQCQEGLRAKPIRGYFMRAAFSYVIVDRMLLLDVEIYLKLY